MSEFEQEMISIMKEFKNEVVSSINELSSKIEGMANISGFDSDLDAIDKMLENKGNVPSVEKNISDLQEHVYVMRNDIAEIAADVEKIRKYGEIERLNTNVNGEKLDDMLTILKSQSVLSKYNSR